MGVDKSGLRIERKHKGRMLIVSGPRRFAVVVRRVDDDQGDLLAHDSSVDEPYYVDSRDLADCTLEEWLDA